MLRSDMPLFGGGRRVAAHVRTCGRGSQRTASSNLRIGDALFESRKIRVLVADEETLVIRALSGIVNGATDMTAVGEAGSGCEALQMYRVLRPDVTLMDIRLLRTDGSQAIAAILGFDPAAMSAGCRQAVLPWSGRGCGPRRRQRALVQERQSAGLHEGNPKSAQRPVRVVAPGLA